MDLDDRELSRLARRGSGSATRSIFGGLVRWNAGHDDASSYAEPVACEMDLAMVVVVLSKHDKLISSTRAMRATMSTSPLFPAWAEASGKDLQVALEAVRVGDLERLGEVVEGNALGMHATMMAARPGIIYWLPQTVAALHEIRAMRQEGLPVWATIDAGPNVKVLTECSPRRMALAHVWPCPSRMEECLSICFLACGPHTGERVERVEFRDEEGRRTLNGIERIGRFSEVASPT